MDCLPAMCSEYCYNIKFYLLTDEHTDILSYWNINVYYADNFGKIISRK